VSRIAAAAKSAAIKSSRRSSRPLGEDSRDRGTGDLPKPKDEGDEPNARGPAPGDILRLRPATMIDGMDQAQMPKKNIESTGRPGQVGRHDR